jgi:patatin-like phospholipase/acyl hydrolase
MAKYRILAFDGGGVRGLLAAVLLQQLDGLVPGWRDKVDLLAGNSTGGIIALGLAKGLDPEKLRTLYYDRSPVIFRDSFLDDLRDLGNVVGAEYSNKNLRKELEAVLGVTRLQDLKRRVLIASFDLDNEDPNPAKRGWKPKFFHNFPGEDTDGRERAVDVALYTSAAPTYFPSVDGYIDGGVVANNPSMAAIAQTQDERAKIPERPRLEEIVLLSIGTGRVMSRIEGKRRDWGLAQWAKPLVKLMLYGTVGVPDYQCRQMLGDRYHRLDYTFAPGYEIDIDEFPKRDRLVDIGENRMGSELASTADWLGSHWCPG